MRLLSNLKGKPAVLPDRAIRRQSHYFIYRPRTSFSMLMLAAMVEFQTGGVFNRCSLYHALETGTVELPPAIPLPGQTQPVPYFFVADDAFAMRNYIMKPYPFKDQPAPNRIFN